MPPGTPLPPLNDPNTGAPYAAPNPQQLAPDAPPPETYEQKQARIQAAAAAQAFENRFNYGGVQGGAAEAAGRYRYGAEHAQGRLGTVVDYSQADWDRMAAGGARNEQGNALGLMRARAYGQVPSIAQMQADRQMGQAAAEQSSAAASARGPAGLALAQQQAANNTAAMQSTISNQAQINGAQERERAENAYLGAGTQMRAGDMQAGGMAQQKAQYQAQMNDAQRSRDDAMQLGLTQAEIDVNKTQSAAQQNLVGLQMGAANAAANRAQAADQYDSSRLDKYVGMGLGAVGTGAGIFALGALGGSSGPAPAGTAGVAGGGNQSDQAGWDSGGSSAPVNTGDMGAPSGDGLSGGYTDENGYWHPSDVTAKENIRPAFAAGEQAGLATRGADPRADAWDEGHRAALQDIQKLAGKSPEELKSYGDNPTAQAVRGLKADAWDEGRRGGAPARQETRDLASGDNQADPGTAQLANGLMPSFYDYKQGVRGATPGTKFGPMAQNMAANPATATAVRQDPRTGLLGIDSKDGLKVALGGVGHLAQRQAQTEQQLALLRNGIAGLGQQQGDGPSIGQNYLDVVRGYGYGR